MAEQIQDSSPRPISEPDPAFTLFPRLPIELRLRIWRLALPGARCVSLYTENDIPTAGLKHYYTAILNQRLPITLQVNVESRTETLRHYQILYQSDAPGFNSSTKKYDRPLCINPKADTVMLSTDSFSESRRGMYGPPLQMRVTFTNWMAYLDNSLSGGLKSLRFMHIIDDIYLEESRIGTILFPEGPPEQVPRGMQLFHRLEKLNISFRDRYAQEELNVSNLLSHQQNILEWYQKYHDTEPNCQIPDIISTVNSLNLDRIKDIGRVTRPKSYS
ncbi:hypothetical protein BDZ45DRAFT_798628 [Acephala macrosclerotiorum]|nr:hypothetical protein BDZ45DRAFT_798628 [Acephala macrosclerotiorum]